MIQNCLENEIYTKVCKTGKEPDLIVMHPTTWQDLSKEIMSNDRLEINRHRLDLSYRGIKVIRSFDLEHGVFEIR